MLLELEEQVCVAVGGELGLGFQGTGALLVFCKLGRHGCEILLQRLVILLGLGKCQFNTP